MRKFNFFSIIASDYKVTVIIFPKPLEIEIFFPELQWCKIFFKHDRYFFESRNFFSPGFSLQDLSP